MTMVKINLKLEIMEGVDKGYILSESDKILFLERSTKSVFCPYRLVLDFYSPEIMREIREIEKEGEEE